MAHFAELDENNVVLRVVVVANAELLDAAGEESEAKGVAFCKALFGEETRWAQTSYNKAFRKNYAAAGMTFRQDLNMFIRPQPFPSWTLDLDAGAWRPPVPLPADSVTPLTAMLFPGEGKVYEWSEAQQNWIEVTNV